MTRGKYLLAKALSLFGIAPLEKYRTSAAFEAHLLREAEAVVGGLAWEQMESVEDLSSEYWKLRKLSKKKNELEKRISELSQVLDESQEARSRAIEEVAEVTKDKVEQRDKTSETIDRLFQEREEILKDGRTIKRAHTGLTTKLEVLMEEVDSKSSSLIAATKAELREKKSQFDAIKQRRDQIDERLSTLQKKLKSLQQDIEKKNQAIREKAEKQFGTIGKTNKELTGLRNQLGSLEGEWTALCSEVGAYVIQNSRVPEIRNVTRKQRGLLTIIQQIQASTFRHRKLIDN